MKGFIYTFLPVLMFLLSTSCEKIIELKPANLSDKIVINAIVSPDTTVIAAIGEIKSIEYEDFSISDGENFTFETEYITGDTYFRNRGFMVKPSSIQSKVKAKVVLNEKEEYSMWINTDTLDSRFMSECRPQAGDKVEIIVEVDSAGYESASAVAEIPAPQSIEVVKHEVIYSQNTPVDYQGYKIPDKSGCDSVMRVTLKINDPGNERNYYRLRVAGAGNKNVTELFSSEDVLFYDPDLAYGYGFVIPAYFSNVFNDDSINGKEYTFVVESRKRNEPNARTIIELQSISADLFYYIKSYMKYRIADFDSFDVPIGIYSNVENGWGIFGASSKTQMVIHY